MVAAQRNKQCPDHVHLWRNQWRRSNMEQLCRLHERDGSRRSIPRKPDSHLRRHKYYTPVTDGYMIDSFFRCLLEISTDGGNTWQPTTATRDNRRNWTSGNLATRYHWPPDTTQGGTPVVIQSALNLFQRVSADFLLIL